jgi:hypothetical protein
MQKLISIKDLVQAVLSSEENEWVYTNKDAWRKNPSTSNFYIISEKEINNRDDDQIYETDDGVELPLELKSENIYPWMLIDIFKGVLQNLKINSWNETDEFMIINGINHYLEFDDFLDAN